MPFYFGKSKDGSDLKEVEGMYVSPDGKEWSNMPYTDKVSREKYKKARIYDEIYNYCAERGLTVSEAFNQIAKKESGLSARCKKMLTWLMTQPDGEIDFSTYKL